MPALPQSAVFYEGDGHTDTLPRAMSATIKTCTRHRDKEAVKDYYLGKTSWQRCHLG